MSVIPLSGFVGAAYAPVSLANTQMSTLVNLLVEKDESGGGRDSLRSRPGLVDWTLSGTGTSGGAFSYTPIRALSAWDDRLFAVAGAHLFEITSLGVVLDRGTLDNDNLPCQVFLNGAQLFIVSAGYGWVYEGGALNRAYIRNGSGVVNTSGTSVTWVSGDKFTSDMSSVNNRIVINDVNYTVAAYVDDQHLTLTASAGTQTGVAYRAYLPLKVSTGAFLGGYFLALVPPSGSALDAVDGKTVRFSNLRDGGFYDPLDIIVKEAQPDNAVAIFVDHEELYVFGSKNSEVWRNTGSVTTFERDPAGSIEFGCASPFSIVKLDSSIYMLAGDSRGKPIAIRLNGYQPQRVSTAAMEQIFESYGTDYSSAVAYSYSEGGHRLWVISFPTAGKTWCYDASVGSWAEWQSSGGRFRGAFHALCWNTHLVADYANGKIYSSSLGVVGESGGTMLHERIARHSNEAIGKHRYHRVMLDMQAGSGASVLMSYTDNDGVAWASDKSATLSASLQRVIWRQLGASRDRVFRFRCTTNTVQSWVNAFVDIEPET